jgi:hypothetical protein
MPRAARKVTATKSNAFNRDMHERRVLEVCGELEDRLQLGWIEITHDFTNGKPDEQATICETDASWKYRIAQLSWNISMVAASTDRGLWDCAIHEYVHVLMGPLKEAIDPSWIDHEEFTTESLARIIILLLDKKFNENGSFRK